MTELARRPEWMSAKAHYLALVHHQAALELLEQLGAPPSASRLFTEVFARRHHFKRVEEGTRAELAAALDLSVKQVTRAAAWLRRHGFTKRSNRRGVTMGVVLLDPAWIVYAVFREEAPPPPALRAPAPAAHPFKGQECPDRRYKDPPSGLRPSGGFAGVPDNGRSPGSGTTANGKRPPGSILRPGKLPIWSAGDVIGDLLEHGGLAPPAPS